MSVRQRNLHYHIQQHGTCDTLSSTSTTASVFVSSSSSPMTVASSSSSVAAVTSPMTATTTTTTTLPTATIISTLLSPSSPKRYNTANNNTTTNSHSTIRKSCIGNSSGITTTSTTIGSSSNVRTSPSTISSSSNGSSNSNTPRSSPRNDINISMNQKNPYQYNSSSNTSNNKSSIRSSIIILRKVSSYISSCIMTMIFHHKQQQQQNRYHSTSIVNNTIQRGGRRKTINTPNRSYFIHKTIILLGMTLLCCISVISIYTILPKLSSIHQQQQQQASFALWWLISNRHPPSSPTSSIHTTTTSSLSSFFLRSSSTTNSYQQQRLYPPRILYYDIGKNDYAMIPFVKSSFQQQQPHINRKINTTDNYMSSNNHDIQQNMIDSIKEDADVWESPHTKNGNVCIPKASWQIQSNPNCNMFHEIPFFLSNSISLGSKSVSEETTNEDGATTMTNHEEDLLSVLGEGWFRTTWRYDHLIPIEQPSTNNKQSGGREEEEPQPQPQQPKYKTEAVVVKTLRIAREFISEYYELHRRDAVAMERLTASPFVVNIYGYCGQSAINEMADFPFPGVQNLENFNRRMRGKDSSYTNAIKLRMAASVALGVADIHAGGTTDPNDMNVYITHYDLNPRNIVLFTGGRPKINDFNVAEFLYYNPSNNNETCNFPSRLHEPWFRAPEEMNTTHTIYVNEKVDIYALGNILYHTLTSHQAHGRLTHERIPIVRPMVAAGITTKIPDHYIHSTDPSIRAIIKAIQLCWTKDPNERATADDIAMLLYDALINITDISSLVTTTATTTAMEKSNSTTSTDTADSNNDDDASDEVEDKEIMGHH